MHDERVPGGGDHGRHLSIALVAGDLLRDGDLGSLFDLGPIGAYFYPPLVHTIGGIAIALDLSAPDGGPIALNLVFVPLLAAGCFLTGRLVYGPTAGMLAAVFALGTPIVLSLFHVFVLDAPLAAMVAISTWALLASGRFAERRHTVLAGALIGLALLIKPTAPLYLVGPVAVMLAAGGWRQWRNLALGAVALLVVAAPYYAMHFDDVLSLSGETTSAGGIQGEGVPFEPEYSNPRFTLDAFAWYGWVALNIQYFLPLLALFAVGLVVAVRELRDRPYIPELLAGLAGGYLALTLLLSIRDPRYSLPMLVFVAVIATGWIASARRTLVRRAAVAVLVGAVVVNVATAVTSRLPTIRIVAPGTEAAEDLIDRGTVTVLDDRGYVVGPPLPDPFWDRLLDAAEREGLRTARITLHQSPPFGTDKLGFAVLAQEYGIDAFTEQAAPDLRINAWWIPDPQFDRLPEPCGSVPEGITPYVASVTEGVSSEPVDLLVAVQRRRPDGGYERWCDFLQ